MKNIDGVQIIKYLRSSGYCGRIILSSSVDITSLQSIEIDAIIEKPYTLEEISSIIEGMN